MTEEEKRALALSIMAAEQNRSPLSISQERLDRIMRRSAQQHELYASLAQQGITWQDLKQAYDVEYERGQSEMIRFRLSFFYGSLAIAFHDQFSTTSQQTASFLHRVEEAMDAEESRESLVQRCLTETGVEVQEYDRPQQQCKATRRDRAAVERMRRTGITQKDLDEERRIGYQHGWNRDFFHSVCYAAVAILLRAEHGLRALEIVDFIDRIEAVADEEISTADIIERAKSEAGVDVNILTQKSMR